jgi:amino acid adenylation domain-containing protein
MTTNFSSVSQRVWSQALQNPHGTACVFRDKQISYGQLVQASLRISEGFKRELHGRRGCPIALCTDNPYHMIVAAIAAWDLGCPYLPVSPSYPGERLRHMFVEAQAPLVAVSEASSSCLPAGPWAEIGINRVLTGSADPRTGGYGGNPNIGAEDLAYVIYTSGSTGKPKGVAVTHANLNNLIAWYLKTFDVTSEDRATQVMALTSDVSAIEIWPHLERGVPIYFPERATYLDPSLLRNYIVANEITLCQAPMLLAEQLLMLDWPGATRLRFLQTGGEALQTFPSSELPFKVVNNYGPTECTVVSTSGIVAPADGPAQPSIGCPITGVEVFLLDSNFQLVPPGEPGEIFIAGAGVSAGYIGRPDLTKESFVTKTSLSTSRLYRTGDIARELPNGHFVFGGRIDDQIKLRGHRLEPAEITFALRKHPAIRAAAVTTIGSGIRKQLVAYVVVTADVTVEDLRTHLKVYLPDYMIPELFVRIAHVPTTTHGKADVSALPVPNASNLMNMGHSSADAMTQIQMEIASLLCRLLERSGMSLQDNFFRLGGNSLLAARVVAGLRQRFGVDVPLRTVFECPTLAGLSVEVEKRIVEKAGGELA